MMLCKKLDKAELPLFLKAAPKQWLAETKEDGDRVRMQVVDSKIKLFNRRGIEVTEKYPEFSKPIALKDCLIDGEMCVLNEDGISLFNEGISYRSHCKNSGTIREAMGKYPVTYVVFDVCEAGGENMRDKPLKLRREVLELMMNVVDHPNIKIVEQTTDINWLWTEITKLNGEGIILKDPDSLYYEGKRSGSWLKVKDIKEVDLCFVKYEEHPKGITIETEDKIRVTVNGHKAESVRSKIDLDGSADVAIRHLGETGSGKFRQPVFHKLN